MDEPRGTRRRNPLRVAAGCHLQETGGCIGRAIEVNTDITWHECIKLCDNPHNGPLFVVMAPSIAGRTRRSKRDPLSVRACITDAEKRGRKILPSSRPTTLDFHRYIFFSSTEEHRIPYSLETVPYSSLAPLWWAVYWQWRRESYVTTASQGKIA